MRLFQELIFTNLENTAVKNSRRNHWRKMVRHRTRFNLELLEPRRVLATLTVTSPSDSGSGSLREAVDIANASVGHDTIVFDEALGTHEIRLNSSEITITDALTIDGSAFPAGVTIDASDGDSTPGTDGGGIRIFRIDDGDDTDAPVTLQNLTITGGDVFGNGGGISSAESLTLIGTTVDTNVATGRAGGISTSGRTLTLTDSAISGNRANRYAAFERPFGPGPLEITIVDSSVSDNVATDSGAFYVYGGFSPNSQVLIRGSEILDNVNGGGNFHLHYTQIEIRDTIISGNGYPLNVRVENQSQFDLVDSVISNNQDPFFAYNAIFSEFNVFGTTIDGNSEGGLSLVNYFYSDANVVDSTITNNSGSGASVLTTYGGDVRFENTVISDNQAERGGGLLIYQTDNRFEIIESVVSGNTAALGGAGIYMRGFSSELAILRSTVADNVNTAAYDGGGVKLRSRFVDLTIQDSTVSGNSTRGLGGGIAVDNYLGEQATMELIQSTISGNVAYQGGGGIYLATDSSMPATMRFATVADNLASAGFADGGGIKSVPDAEVTMYQTLVADNESYENVVRVQDDVVGGNVTAYYSLIEAPAGTISGSDNVFGQDPLLLPLTDNGGLTETHGLPMGSPALEVDLMSFIGGPFDQRGAPFDRLVGNRPDIGAFESQVLNGGDFANDGILDCDDLDLLTLAIAKGNYLLGFDVNFDGTLDIGDVDAWLTAAGRINLPSGNSYLFGDANLDGVVDGSDFIIWNANRFSIDPRFCSGDFNVDGVVDGQDFIVWNAHRFQSSLDLALPVAVRDFYFAGRDTAAGHRQEEASTTDSSDSIVAQRVSHQWRPHVVRHSSARQSPTVRQDRVARLGVGASRIG